MITGFDDEILRWVLANELKNSKGVPFEFKNHMFMVDPLIDWHPQQAINKGSQIGGSETIGLLKAIYAAKRYGLNVIYTLPSDKFLQKFVPPKVDGIVTYNPSVMRDVKGNQSLKVIPYYDALKGKSKRHIYFMGTHSSKAEDQKEESDTGISVTSDLNIHDEASRSDQFILNQLRSRLDDSDYKGRWLFDNPSYPFKGADAVFRQGDQRVWVVKCEHCGYRQYMDWFRLDQNDYESGTVHCWVDVEKKEFICGKCRGVLTPYARRTGEWVAKFPTRTEVRSYWMPKLIYIKHTAASLLALDNDPTYPKSQFHNYSLAKPYVGSDVKISREHIIGNYDLERNFHENNAMGVDQGVLKHYVIGNAQGIFKVGVTDSFEEIERLKVQYNATTVIDALPAQRWPKLLTAKYKDIYRAFYKPEKDQLELAKFGTKIDPRVVLIRRSEVFDIIVDRILDKQFPIQIPVVDLDDYIRHWTSMVRIVQRDRDGNDRFDWETTTGEDHFAHATLYFWVAMLRSSGGKATVRSKTPEKEEVIARPSSGTESALTGDQLLKEFLGKTNSTVFKRR